MNFEQRKEPSFDELTADYINKKDAYDRHVSQTQEEGTYAAATSERHSRRGEQETSRLALKESLRRDPKLAREVFKKEWRQFFDTELRSNRHTYEGLLQGEGGAPKTDIYEMAKEAFDGDSGVFDGEARNTLTEQVLEEAHQAFLEEERLKREVREGERKEGVPLPQQKEAVTASEERPAKEFSPNPEMDAQLRDMYLSYADAPVTIEEKEKMLKWTRESESARKYAESFRHLAEQRNLLELEAIGKEMVSEVKEVLAKLEAPISPYGESRSWALWDIAKQEYFAEHPDETNSEYVVGGIFELPEKREEILNRHIGWELYKAYQEGRHTFIDRLKEGKEDIVALLKKPAKENGTLRSLELARLGALVRKG